jgi:hypothetical protein
MKPRDEVRIVESDRGAYAFDTRTGRSFSLNSPGLAIWNELKAGHSTSQITATLTARFANVPSADIADDVAKFVTQLTERDLISP